MPESGEVHGWVARQRARLAAVLMTVGANIHPFENDRALRVLHEAFDDENRSVDTETDQP